MIYKKITANLLLFWIFLSSCGPNDNVGQLPFYLDKNTLVIQLKGQEYKFEPQFMVLYSEEDPELAMRPAGLENIQYNVPTWLAYQGKETDLEEVKRGNSQTGDGFDDRILKGNTGERTANVFNAGEAINLIANNTRRKGDTLFFEFPEHQLFDLKAQIVYGEDLYPKMRYELSPKVKGYFSVGYMGSPDYPLDQVEEIWQPFIWQEKRFPAKPYMTLAYRAPLPTVMVDNGTHTLGLLAAPEEYPFDPLPLQKNSRFGIMVRNQEGKAQPQLFAPVMGGTESKMGPSESYSFTAYLVVEPQPVTYTYEKIARSIYGFGDYRKNAISSLNDTFENIVDYSMSDFARFVDSLKGFSYSTDVPGAVKNVSSLHPLELSFVMDRADIFNQRAYPLMEYMMSREKFLFSLDREQKIQYPSREMHGPVAPISELVALYNIFDRKNDFFLQMAKDEYKSSRVRNLDVKEKGETWINAIYLYQATGDNEYLEKAKKGADEYLENRVNSSQETFKDPFAGSFFFWTSFTNRWIELLQLYELTGEQKYLKAAQDGARHYTMFTWMSPAIPDSTILVNEGGKAPMYWYLEAKGHKQMYYPEEKVPAWRLSAMGLTPESSGTSTGHRAIFMANYAPWMLRLGYYANDDFLKDVAKASIIGRYRNFPGYHINTARTTAYEKEDYPLHEHKELSVNSFHYNHIMPMASMLLDYLVTDAFVRSDGNIDFPSEYMEGYAYLKNKFYGHKRGTFYDEKDLQLWMPEDLLRIDHVELNYISARKNNQLFLVFMNQSDVTVQTNIIINEELVGLNGKSRLATFWRDNRQIGNKSITGNHFEIKVSPDGITAVKINDVDPAVSFQHKILAAEHEQISNDYRKLKFGKAWVMLFELGTYGNRAYIYLRDDDSVFKSVTLNYVDSQGNRRVMKDEDFPFEFTILPGKRSDGIKFDLSGIDVDNQRRTSKTIHLGEKE